MGDQFTTWLSFQNDPLLYIQKQKWWKTFELFGFVRFIFFNDKSTRYGLFNAEIRFMLKRSLFTLDDKNEWNRMVKKWRIS